MRNTDDPNEIRSIACHPAVWPGFGGKSDAEAWEPPIREGIDWLIGDGVLVAFIRLRAGCWEAHIGALPEARGTVKRQALEALQWLSDHRGHGTVIGFIPSPNPAAVANARAVGMKVLMRTADRTIVGKEI